MKRKRTSEKRRWKRTKGRKERQNTKELKRMVKNRGEGQTDRGRETAARRKTKEYKKMKMEEEEGEGKKR